MNASGYKGPNRRHGYSTKNVRIERNKFSGAVNVTVCEMSCEKSESSNLQVTG